MGNFSDKVINGTDIILKIGGKIVACATSHSLELTPSVRDTSCKDAGDFTASVSGRMSWSVSTDALINLGRDNSLYASYTDVMDWALVGTEVAIESLINEGTEFVAATGNAIITSVNQTSGDQDNASFSLSLQGNGALVFTEGVRLTAPSLELGTIDINDIDLSWTDTNTSPNEIGVLVEMREADGDWITYSTEPADSIGVNVTGLTSATEYSFRVSAVSAITLENSERSNVVTGTTL